MARGGWAVALLVAALAAGCLSAPPDGIAVDSGASASDAGGDDASGACPEALALAPFSDDFATDALAWALEPKPSRDGAGAIQMSIKADQLVFEPRAAGGDYAWLQTVPFDFTSARIAVRIPELSTDGSSQPYLGIIGPAAEELMFRFDGTHLAGPTGNDVLYLPAVHLWWQVSSESGAVRFQTSEDGVTWSDIDAVEAAFELDAVLFEVGINVDLDGPASRGVFSIDDLDLPPCL
ncbi:MAG TPA: hypothetical protein VIG06_23620 [Kofleriaceae bacterium]|jgi:hypothetical protein